MVKVAVGAQEAHRLECLLGDVVANAGFVFREEGTAINNHGFAALIADDVAILFDEIASKQFDFNHIGRDNVIVAAAHIATKATFLVLKNSSSK